MEFATIKDDVRLIDVGSNNKWRWDWIQNTPLETCIRKTLEDGKAWCTVCRQTLKYGSSGKKLLFKHVDSAQHISAVKTIRTKYSVAGFLTGAMKQSSSEVRPVVPVNQRTTQLEAMVLGFVAENDLPFTITSSLIGLMKAGAADSKALSGLTMERTTASYKMVHGIGRTFTNSLVEKLRGTLFSLNLDESTSNNLKKVVAVLVSYFCSDKNEVVVQHLDLFDIIRADSNSFFCGLVNIFHRHRLPWSNLVSSLMDSCSTMRGCKSGLETRIRALKAPHMLDIDGDSVHHAHNAAKAFCKPFEGWLERLFKDLHSDFHWSTDLRTHLSEICQILNIKFTMPERFLNHRFLSAYNLAVDTQRLLDALSVFYSAFLPKDQKDKYRFVHQEIIHRKGVSGPAHKMLSEIAGVCGKKVMTNDGKERKRRIIEHLFTGRLRTRILLSVYVGVLQQLKEYVMLFQMKEPLIHALNDEQVNLMRTFMALFIKPEAISRTGSRLAVLDVNKSSIQLLSNSVSVGHSTTLKSAVEKKIRKG